MKMLSNEKQPKFKVLGSRVFLAFNEAEKFIQDSTVYEYDSAEWAVGANRSQVIEAIIRVKYPTLGAELAVINGGDTQEMIDYQEFRLFAKETATEWAS
jgi:hypothetical protein